MSKEREAFEAWALGRWSMLQHPNGDYVYNKAQAAWLGFQQATSHYQPLLDAKDAEIARLERKLHFYVSTEPAVSAEGQRLQDENTTLKAVIEQAREGLEESECQCDGGQCNRCHALAAINAATGKGE